MRFPSNSPSNRGRADRSSLPEYQPTFGHKEKTAKIIKSCDTDSKWRWGCRGGKQTPLKAARLAEHLNAPHKQRSTPGLLCSVAPRSANKIINKLAQRAGIIWRRSSSPRLYEKHRGGARQRWDVMRANRAKSSGGWWAPSATWPHVRTNEAPHLILKTFQSHFSVWKIMKTTIGGQEVLYFDGFIQRCERAVNLQVTVVSS